MRIGIKCMEAISLASTSLNITRNELTLTDEPNINDIYICYSINFMAHYLFVSLNHCFIMAETMIFCVKVLFVQKCCSLNLIICFLLFWVVSDSSPLNLIFICYSHSFNYLYLHLYLLIGFRFTKMHS